jgi:hypothetical protein
MIILSQALLGSKEGATTNVYGLEQPMEQHERVTSLVDDDIVWTYTNKKV